MTRNQLIVAGFLEKGRTLLPVLTREYLGRLLAGTEVSTAYRELLALALQQIGQVDCTLTTSEQVEVANFFLVQAVENVGTATPPPVIVPTPLSLLLGALAPKVRGQYDGTPLLVTGRLSGTVPANTIIQLSRDGKVIAQLYPSSGGTFSFEDATPGVRYRAEAVGTGLVKEQVRPMISPVLYGVLPHDALPKQLLRLPQLVPGFVENVARISVVGARNRIFLLVPVEVGRVQTIKQPNDNNSDITPAFSHTPATLDFGLDGTGIYDVIENSANFIGPFTFDAYLTPPPPTQDNDNAFLGTAILPMLLSQPPA